MQEPQPTAAQPTAAAPGPRPWPPRPTLAPPGRLVRLGVVLDLDGPLERLREIARMCDRAGIGALWVEEPDPVAGRPAGLDAWTALTLVAPAVARSSLGAMLLAGARPAGALARMAATLGAGLDGRLEIGLRGGDPDGLLAELTRLARELAPVAEPGAEPGAEGGAEGGPPLPALTAALPADPAPGLLGLAAAVADNLLLPPVEVGQVRTLGEALRQAARAAGRDPATLGIAARLPVSVGRTQAEAQARWDATASFAGLGAPERVAVFGTLERCHETVIGLAHAGVTELRCLLPDAIDVHDVIAQLTALSIGTVETFAPGAPRSPAPAPPEGWGGRPRFPR